MHRCYFTFGLVAATTVKALQTELFLSRLLFLVGLRVWIYRVRALSLTVVIIVVLLVLMIALVRSVLVVVVVVAVVVVVIVGHLSREVNLTF